MSSTPAISRTGPGEVEEEADAGDVNADVASAKRVLGVEAAALETLAQCLGEDFTKALDIMAAVTGRVVVSGMGKSGHVGHKIAATLSSTGTPALFVHPAEASHGDLGMIAKGDAMFALSNSGETPELADMVAYAKLFLANPDLPRRLQAAAALNEPDKATFYGGGAEGYTDYPLLADEPSLGSISEDS